MRTNGLWSPYPGTHDAILQGSAPPNLLHSNWIGYETDAATLTKNYWSVVLNGAKGVWWWMWFNVGTYMGLLRPDGTVYDAAAEMMEDTRITREGLGDLIMHSTFNSDGIAVLYSMPSFYSETMLAGSYGTWTYAVHNNWQTLLRSGGYTFSYITDGMLRRGEIGSGVKMLVLPRVEAMTDDEAQRIMSFAEAGGIVLADQRTGLYDGHVKRRSGAGALDGFFGISTRSSSNTAMRTAKVNVSLADGEPETQLAPVIIDGGIRNVGATSFGKVLSASYTDAAVMCVKSVGTKGGKAIFLNMALSPTTRDVIIDVIARHGITKPVSIVPGVGVDFGVVRLHKWRNGDAVIVGVMTANNGSGTLVLTEQRRVLDLRSHADMGVGTSFRVSFNGGRATFFVLLPAAGGSVHRATLVITGRNMVMAGSVPNLRVTVPWALSDHAGLLRVELPGGGDADWLEQVVFVPRGGVVELPIPTALNDPEGWWTIRFTDVFGAISEVKLFVSHSKLPDESTVVSSSVRTALSSVVCAIASAFLTAASGL